MLVNNILLNKIEIKQNFLNEQIINENSKKKKKDYLVEIARYSSQNVLPENVIVFSFPVNSKTFFFLR